MSGRLRACLFALSLAVATGCGSNTPTSENKPADTKGASGRLNVENTHRIVSEQMDLNHVRQMFASPGEATNDEKPGLMMGNKFVWKEDGKKVYVSFSPIDGKANGIAWEGFGGR